VLKIKNQSFSTVFEILISLHLVIVFSNKQQKNQFFEIISVA
jgi:hypothetical protein